MSQSSLPEDVRELIARFATAVQCARTPGRSVFFMNGILVPGEVKLAHQLNPNVLTFSRQQQGGIWFADNLSQIQELEPDTHEGYAYLVINVERSGP